MRSSFNPTNWSGERFCANGEGIDVPGIYMGLMTPPVSLALCITAGAEANGLKSYWDMSLEVVGLGNGHGDRVAAMMGTGE